MFTERCTYPRVCTSWAELQAVFHQILLPVTPTPPCSPCTLSAIQFWLVRPCFWWHNVNVRTFVFRWTESMMIASWHTMGECFVKWLADWLKWWMRQRRKSTMRYSLENFCCISLKIFGEPDKPIRIYAHPTKPVKQSEKCLAEVMRGKKTCVFLSAAGLLFWEKNWKELTFNTCHCCRFSNGDIDKLLRNYWNHMFSSDVERFWVRWNLCGSNLWVGCDRVKWGTCDPYLMFDWATNVTAGKKQHI